MDEVLKWLVGNIPNLTGLAVLAWVLYKQNERLTEALLGKITMLEARVDALEKSIIERAYNQRAEPYRPPHNHRDPQDYPDDDM